MGELTKPESRETVANRAPYCGEYTSRNDKGEWDIKDAGEWEINEDYVDADPSPV